MKPAIDCDLCRETAPATFRRDETRTVMSYVWKQTCNRGKSGRLPGMRWKGCPTETIGCKRRSVIDEVPSVRYFRPQISRTSAAFSPT
jgi:hypothetical protein